MYEFKLTPAYCLFNGTAIMSQHGAEIMFLMENLENVVLQGRLRRAFEEYLLQVLELDDCPEIYRKKAKVDFVQGSRDQLRKCISSLYKVNHSLEKKAETEISVQQKEAAAVLLLDSVLHDARERNATDIHIEGNRIRFRVLGKLENVMEVQRERCEELIQRIKLLGGMNVIEKHRSQDGRFVYGKESPIFVRVSSISVLGRNQEEQESLVLRLLDTSRIPLNLDLLGFNYYQLEKMQELIAAKNGLVLVCGATGAGKSTTIASMLVELESKAMGKLKIISMEDPPEYVIPGVTQIQIDERIGNTYEEILSHVFRQDPDVLMIGEIRDEKTAMVAIKAALTGHLVFATLHTGGAGESILRLENLGIERKLLVSVLRGIICQELDVCENQTNLCADVAVPKARFSILVKDFMGEEELDGKFEHITNYSEVLTGTLRKIGAKTEVHPDTEIKPVSKKHMKGKSSRIWKGKSGGKKIYKKIG